MFYFIFIYLFIFSDFYFIKFLSIFILLIYIFFCILKQVVFNDIKKSHLTYLPPFFSIVLPKGNSPVTSVCVAHACRGEDIYSLIQRKLN